MDTPAAQHYQPVAQTPAVGPLEEQPATPLAIPYLPTYHPMYASSTKDENSTSSPNAVGAEAAGPGALAPWTHRSATLFLVILAALLQTALLAASIEIVANPVQYPTGTGVGKLSVKTFNESFRRVGEARFPEQLSRYSVLPLVVFAISTLSSPAVVSIWTASPERASFGFGLNYTSVTHNADYYQSRVANQARRWVALHEEEYDGLVFALSRVVNGNGVTAAPTKSDLDALFTQVDGVNSSIADGIVPSMHQIANLFNRNATELDSDMLEITRAASANVFKLQAPTTIASSTCTARTDSTLIFGDWAVTGPTFSFNVTDTSCPGTTWTINLTDDADEYASAITCMNTTSLSYVGYFFVNFTDSTSDPVFSPLASCYTSVSAGISSDITYTSLNRSYELSHATLAGGLDNGTDVDVTALSNYLVSREWASWTQFGRGSEALLTFAQNVYTYFDVDTTIDIFEILSRAMHAMVVTKQVAIDTYWIVEQERYTEFWDGTVPDLTSELTTVTADVIQIGPSGWNSLYIAVVAATWLAVVVALVCASRYRPVDLDPLDPISVMLVAQNSPPSIHLHGGCHGDSDRIPEKEVKMYLREVEPEHLGFVFGGEAASSFEPPAVGRHYGASAAFKRP